MKELCIMLAIKFLVYLAVLGVAFYLTRKGGFEYAVIMMLLLIWWHVWKI